MVVAGQVGERVVVGRRGDLGAVPEAGAVRHRPGRVHGEHGQAAPAERRPDLGAGRPPERVLDRGRVPALQERRVVVVHRERAARCQVGAHRLERLLGEQVALQPDPRLPGQRGQRVGQREQDQVVVLRGVLQEGAAVIDVRGQPGAGVGVVRVHVAEPHQQRVDLHRVDVPGALGQGDGRVVARPGPDDQDVAQRRLGDVPVGVEVERLLLVHHGQGTGRLVGDVVRGHVQRRGSRRASGCTKACCRATTPAPARPTPAAAGSRRRRRRGSATTGSGGRAGQAARRRR